MFRDIGKKIKTLAIVVCAIGMSASILWGGYIVISGLKLSSTSLVLTGMIRAIIGCILSWIAVFLLYGFGELIDKTCSIETMISERLSDENYYNYEDVNNANNAMNLKEGTIICPNCGSVELAEDYYCQKCKTRLK